MQIKVGQEVDCRRCHGDGIVTGYRYDHNGAIEQPVICQACGGTGKQAVVAEPSQSEGNAA